MTDSFDKELSVPPTTLPPPSNTLLNVSSFAVVSSSPGYAIGIPASGHSVNFQSALYLQIYFQSRLHNSSGPDRYTCSAFSRAVSCSELQGIFSHTSNLFPPFDSKVRPPKTSFQNPLSLTPERVQSQEES